MPIAREYESDFVPAPAGPHPARCIGVVALGTQEPSNPAYKPSNRVLLTWELPEELIEFNGERKPMTIFKEYALSLGRANKPTALREDLQRWRTKAFTPDEANGFDIKNVLGKACLITIDHQPKRDGSGIRAVVSCVNALPRGMMVKPQVHPSLSYEIEEGNSPNYQKLAPWIQKKIGQSQEFTQGPTEPVVDESETEVIDEDSVPF